MRRLLRRVALPALCTSTLTAAGVIIGMNIAERAGGPRFYYNQLPQVDAPQRSILTPLHYQASGWRRYQTFLEHNRWGGALVTAYQLVRPACVRVTITLLSGDEGEQSANASGILVGGGRYVLTAGHALEGHVRREAEVTLVSGYTLAARFIEWDYAVLGSADQDWALLAVDAPPDFTAPSVELGSPAEGDLALIVGYPDLMGIDASGDVAYDATRGGGFLEPIATAGEIETVSPIVLRPRAGAVPTGGMSGAPVVNSRGELIGVFVSVSRTESTTYAVYSYNAASIDAVRRALDKEASDSPITGGSLDRPR